MRSIISRTLVAGIIFISSVSYANGPVKKDSIVSEECLEVVGIAVGNCNQALDSVEVKLFKENEELEWTEITNVAYHDHNFKFTLEANAYYTIEVSKPGYVKRSIAISTKLPSDVKIKPLFRYQFDVILFKESKEGEDYFLDFPVAVISYNEKSSVFENNNTYTKKLKANIKSESDHVMVGNMINGK